MFNLPKQSKVHVDYLGFLFVSALLPPVNPTPGDRAHESAVTARVSLYVQDLELAAFSA